MSSNTNRQQQAIDILPEAMKIILSDTQKSVHGLKQAISLAIVAKNTPKATRLAILYRELEEFSISLELELSNA